MDFHTNTIDSKLCSDSDNDSLGTFLEASYAAHAYILCRLMHENLDSPADNETIEKELNDILKIISQINNE